MRMVDLVGKGANQQYETKPDDAYATSTDKQPKRFPKKDFL